MLEFDIQKLGNLLEIPDRVKQGRLWCKSEPFLHFHDYTLKKGEIKLPYESVLFASPYGFVESEHRLFMINLLIIEAGQMEGIRIDKLYMVLALYSGLS